MDIAIGSYKLRIEIVLVGLVLLWILFGHLLCSCCTVSFREGFDLAKGGLLGGMKGALEGLTDAAKKRESYQNMNYAFESHPASYKLGDNSVVDTSSWSNPNLTYNAGGTPGAGALAILDRKKQPIPLPNGELDMFATTPFKPECCPNTYSNSMGCACMTVDQWKYLNDRGGNNVPYSEY